jgi:hypothetical protein
LQDEDKNADEGNSSAFLVFILACFTGGYNAETFSKASGTKLNT